MLLFDAITIVVYPIVGDLLGLDGEIFGIWAGVSMFSTGPVVAGQWATMTKLARNALLGFVVLGYASLHARSTGGGRPSLRTLWDAFPTFVLGFVALAVLASAGVLAPAHRTVIEHGYDWLFLLAFVGLGTEICIDELRDTGVTPAIVVLMVLCLGSAFSLALLTIVF